MLASPTNFPSESLRDLLNHDLSPHVEFLQPINEPSEISVKYGLPKFDNLKVSTCTVMIYANIIFDTDAIFNSIKITDVEAPLTKKQKNIDKKKVVAPRGAIISVQHGTKFRGIYLKKKKRHWCTICRPIRVIESKEKKDLTVTEHFIKVNEENTKNDISQNSGGNNISGGGKGMWEVVYHCMRCQKTYRASEMKKISHFLNQTTLIISLGKTPLLHAMMFRDSIKIVGCNDSNQDARDMMMLLWNDYLLPQKDKWWRLKEGETDPKFYFRTVMRNVDFHLGFFLFRDKLNFLMNEEKYADRVCMSEYEPTGHTNVNIKMYARRPDGYTFECLTVPFNRKPYSTQVKDIPYQKKKDKEEMVTLIVFSSSEIILSGRYKEDMRNAYNFFIKLVFENRDSLEEKLIRRMLIV